LTSTGTTQFNGGTTANGALTVSGATTTAGLTTTGNVTINSGQLLLKPGSDSATTGIALVSADGLTVTPLLTFTNGTTAAPMVSLASVVDATNAKVNSVATAGTAGKVASDVDNLKGASNAFFDFFKRLFTTSN
jgi:hypothetical protein